MARRKATTATKETKEAKPARVKNAVSVAVVENGIASRANIDAITDKELKKTASTLYTLATAAKRNLYAIAVILRDVNANKTYERAGYKDVFAFANAVCGYGKPMVYNLIQIADKYTVVDTDDAGKVTGVHSAFIDDTGNDFSVSQLQEMKALETDDAAKLINGGAVNKGMTTKKIRDVVKAFNDGRVTFDDDGKATVKPAEKTASEKGDDSESETDIDAAAVAVMDILNALDVLTADSRVSASNRAALANIRATVNNIAKNDLGVE